MRKKLSVIMPSYNSEKYLSDAIESVINQNYPNIELLIIDDNSTDDSFSIAKKYEDRLCNVRVLKNSTNLGISKTRNIGLKNCTGDYISFCDDDDVVLPGCYEDNMALLDDDVDIVRWGYFEKEINEDGIVRHTNNIVTKKNVYSTKEEIFADYDNIHKVIDCVWTGIYKRELITNNSIYFNESFRFGAEDTEFNIRLLRFANKIVVNDGQYYVWNVRDAHSTTQKRDCNFCDSFIQTAIEEYRLMNDYCADVEVLWKKYKRDYYDYCIYYAKSIGAQEHYEEVFRSIGCFA